MFKLITLFVLFAVAAHAAVTWTPCAVMSNDTAYSYSFQTLDYPTRVMIHRGHSAMRKILNKGKPVKRNEEFENIIPHYSIKRQGGINIDPTNLAAECTTVPMTLNRNSGDNRTIEFYVKRVFFNNGQNPTACRRQIWVNQGGPGAPGDNMERLAFKIAKNFTDACVYVPDHRGTGRSTYVDCDLLETDTDCQARLISIWGVDGASAFRTTEAAHDVIEFMQMMRDDENQTEITLYGVSYGTYLVNRILQIAPTLVRNAIIDGIVDPIIGNINDPYVRLDGSGRTFFNKCGQDSFCSSKLTTNPVSFAFNVYSKIDAGHCPVFGANSTDLKQILLTFNILRLYAFSYSLLYRIDRCNPQDITVMITMIQWFNTYITARSRTPANPSSDYVFKLITVNELYNASITPAVLEQQERNAVLFSSYGNDVYDIAQGWTILYNDIYDDAYATSAVTANYLLLNGDLDFQTPVAWSRAYNQNSPVVSRTYAEVSNANHGTAFDTLIRGSSDTCGLSLIKQLVRNGALPNTGCTAQTNAVDFQGTSSTYSTLSITDFYENDGSVSSAYFLVPTFAFILLAFL